MNWWVWKIVSFILLFQKGITNHIRGSGFPYKILLCTFWNVLRGWLSFESLYSPLRRDSLPPSFSIIIFKNEIYSQLIFHPHKPFYFNFLILKDMLIIWEHDLYYFHNHIDSKNKTIQCTDNWKAINNIEQVLFVIIDIILFIHINTIAKWQYETTNYKRKSGKRKRKEGNNMFKHG